MQRNTIMIRDQEGDQNSLNKNELEINRGAELLLRNRGRIPKEPKTFSTDFDKLFYLFNKEVQIEFKFSIDIKKRKSPF